MESKGEQLSRESGDALDRSTDNPTVLASAHSQSEVAGQHSMDLAMLMESVEELIRSISLSFDGKTQCFLIRQEQGTEATQVPREEMALTLNELNAEAFVYLQQQNMSLAFCVLKKAAFFCEVVQYYIAVQDCFSRNKRAG